MEMKIIIVICSIESSIVHSIYFIFVVICWKEFNFFANEREMILITFLRMKQKKKLYEILISCLLFSWNSYISLVI